MTQQPSDSQSSSLKGNTTDSENLDDYRDFYLVGEQCIRATNFPGSFKPCSHNTSNSNVPSQRGGMFGMPYSSAPAPESNRAAEFEQTVSVDSTLWLIDFIRLV